MTLHSRLATLCLASSLLACESPWGIFLDPVPAPALIGAVTSSSMAGGSASATSGAPSSSTASSSMVAASSSRMELTSSSSGAELQCWPAPTVDAGPVEDAPRNRAAAAFQQFIVPLLCARHCAVCHAGVGPYANAGINFLSAFPPDAPTPYDSILVYRPVNGVPRLFNFTQLAQSPILATGAHVGPPLTTTEGERGLVLDWLALEHDAACADGTIACQP